MIRTQNEIIKQGYDALISTLGVADTIRFIQYFSPGKGDYTKERHQWLDNKLKELITFLVKNLSLNQPKKLTGVAGGDLTSGSSSSACPCTNCNTFFTGVSAVGGDLGLSTCGWGKLLCTAACNTCAG